MPDMTLKECIDLLREAGINRDAKGPLEGVLAVNIEHINQFNSLKGNRRPGKTGAPPPKASVRRLTGVLPPWGQMADVLNADIRPFVPFDFTLPNGNEPSLDDFANWLLDVLSGIELIWPRYVPGQDNWPDAKVGPLFDADFTIMGRLRDHFGFPISSGLPTIVQHRDFYLQEDNFDIAFGVGYERYDASASRHFLDRLPNVMTAGVVDKMGSIDLILKLIFQRPRPYQVALIQGRCDFTYESSKMAHTPSLVSSHCLNGALAGCTAFDGLADFDVGILKQFTVDVGDRRVFAGVHYPSDNLASWYTAIKLLPNVFEAHRVPNLRKFLWDAINSKSVVFREVKQHVEVNEDSPYGPMVKALAELGAQGEVY